MLKQVQHGRVFLRRKLFHRPTISVFDVNETVVQAAWAALPKLQSFGNDHITAPMRRPWNFAFTELVNLYLKLKGNNVNGT
jgi:hypothetical protein